ncbi:bifunctional SulP family inorganic anion transporter/carbonic anhydrase [Streptomyces sp. AV19]|uniref:SulP family inorganic anion transporter n=1 Tax=Streptomyces sp. AV19 TaxID=2793068 RepID=UPI0018FE1520|nr:SulP family inorganic anion transporter [Streptomyces sp. AV19]MBH1934867.1 bifunctional SulP family inorganic anion transporter/carbonic anhydrase [Streptomyces sp. AV19]MDG4537001.1 SulP family inorganic anion transporter [Streptomyces sp. AV19]
MHAHPTHPPSTDRSTPDPPDHPHRHTARRDLAASVGLALTAVPLSLGVALAAGAPPRAGLVAAAAGGLVAGGLGRTRLRAGGAAVALAAVTAELVHRFGWRATCAITVLAGLAQVALGAARVARVMPAAGPVVARGALAGIGATIALGQLRVVLGGGPNGAPAGDPWAFPPELTHPSVPALLAGGCVLAVLAVWPRLSGRAGRAARVVPAPLAAVALATAVSAGSGLPRIPLPDWNVAPLPALPAGQTLAVCAAVLTMTLVAGMETLTSPADGHRAGDPDRELTGQGAATVVSGLLGGLAVTGATASGAAGAVAPSRKSVILYGMWVLPCAALCAPALKLVPVAALAALILAAGVRMTGFRNLDRLRERRELPVHLSTLGAVALFGVLPGTATGIVVAALLSLRRLGRTRITVSATREGHHRVAVHGQLTFLAVPRLRRSLSRVPRGAGAVVELGGSFMDHAAYDALYTWSNDQRAHGGWVTVSERSGQHVAEPSDGHACRPWTPWRNHHCVRPPASAGGLPGGRQLIGGVSAFQRDTAPLVREELARLAREGQRPSQLFLTCADSRLVTSMITSSGPGDLFTVRNVGNLMPPPGNDAVCDSVAAAVEYAVEVLKVSSITVCGHSGCGAMQALLDTAVPTADAVPQTPLARWLRHGRPSLARMQRIGRLGRGEVALAERPVADDAERLALVNVMQQLDHLMAHSCVARRVAEGTLHLQGMYFHVAEAQAYVLDQRSRTFTAVRPGVLDAV